MSIISYVNLVKMKKVAALLASEKLTLKEVAFEVGITDTSYLSRLFKAKMGMTISDFKANFRMAGDWCYAKSARYYVNWTKFPGESY